MTCWRRHPQAKRASIVQRILPKPRKLGQDAEDEHRVIEEVTLPKAFRLLRQAEQPLHTVALHPQRRLPNSPGKYVKCRPNPDHHCGRKFLKIGRHKSFLLGRTKSYPADVRLRFSKATDQLGLFIEIQRTKGRRVRPANQDTWKSRRERSSQFISHSRCATIKEVPNRTVLRRSTNTEHQIRPIHPIHVLNALQSTDPRHRHPVWRVK